ncbi:hypothetical protein CPB85DRAFT_988366 [Mucidula mucida]|nr:hypothetical protein CPB85DRAFT_988366 [Mucidula mucida]
MMVLQIDMWSISKRCRRMLRTPSLRRARFGKCACSATGVTTTEEQPVVSISLTRPSKRKRSSHYSIIGVCRRTNVRMLHVPQLVGPRPHCCLPSNPDYREDGEVLEAANERKEEKTCSQVHQERASASMPGSFPGASSRIFYTIQSP